MTTWNHLFLGFVDNVPSLLWIRMLELICFSLFYFYSAFLGPTNLPSFLFGKCQVIFPTIDPWPVQNEVLNRFPTTLFFFLKEKKKEKELFIFCFYSISKPFVVWKAVVTSWWEHSPPTVNVARVRSSDSDWVNWFSTLLWEVILTVTLSSSHYFH